MLKKIKPIYNINLLIILFSLGNLNAQQKESNGYFDNKFYVDVVSLINYPLFYNIKTNEFNFSEHDKLNFGYRLGGGFNLGRKVSFAIEFGNDFGSIMNVRDKIITTYKDGYYSYELEYYKSYDRIDINSFSFLPKIEFSSKNGISPIGITHQVGIGLTNTKIETDKMYTYHINYNSYYPSPFIQSGSTKFIDDHKAKVITFLYCLNMRSSITKNIFINYGFRYTFNYSPLRFLLNIDGTSDYDSIDQRIYKYKNLNLITFNLGLTYIFCK